MSIKSYIQIEPVRTLSGVLAFGAALITGLAYNQHWSGDAVSLIGGAWSAFIALVGTFVVREAVTPNAHVQDRVDAAVEAAVDFYQGD